MDDTNRHSFLTDSDTVKIAKQKQLPFSVAVFFIPLREATRNSLLYFVTAPLHMKAFDNRCRLFCSFVIFVEN